MNGPLSLTLVELPHVGAPAFGFAEVAEQLGFRRHWFTEHFETKRDAVGSSIVAATVAATRTRHIRIGTAGILGRYYPAALAAIQFRSLATVFPGRVDAGIAGGWAVDKDHLEADLRDWSWEGKLARFVEETRSARWPSTGLVPPPLWYLGASPQSGRMTGHLGINYGYAFQFERNADDPLAIEAYRQTFLPSEYQAEPQAILAVAGLCSDSVADAGRHVAAAREVWAGGFAPRIFGTPQTCRDQLLALAERYEVDEIAFYNLTRDWDAGRRSLQLLSEALQLPKRS